MNPNRRLELIEKIGSVVGVLFAVAMAVFADLPPCVIVVVVIYVAGLFLYLFLPWDSWTWEQNDEKKKGFKKMFRSWHYGLLTAVLVIPLLCVLGGWSIKWIPRSADEIIVNGIEDASKSTTLMNRMNIIQAHLLQTNAPAQPGSVVGIVKGPGTR